MFSKAHADRAVSFIKLLKHTKGRWRGVDFNLLPWQEKLVRKIFGTLKSDGTRQYRTCFVEIPKKNGKSELAAAIALYLLFADSEEGAEIYSAAADRDQASIVFDVAASMVRMNPALLRRSKIIDSRKRIVVPDTESFYRVLSSEVRTKHGVNAHGVIFDEFHAQPNRELYDVLTQGSGYARSQPLTFIITTAGYDKNSICYEVYEYAKAVKEKVIEDDSFLPVIYELDPEEDWTLEKNWKKVNPSFSVTIDTESFKKDAERAKANPALENVFRRLHLNQWTEQQTRWIPMHVWDETQGIIDRDFLKNKDCYAALDLSSTTDITAFSLVFPHLPEEDDEYHFYVLPTFWIPKDTMLEHEKQDKVPYRAWAKEGLIRPTEGNVVDYKFVKRDILNICSEFRVLEIAYDRWNAGQMVQDLIDEGLRMIPFGQGFASMSSPSKEFLTLLYQKRLHHGGNKVLRWMADNVQVKQDPAGNIKPDKSKSTKRIDGIVATIMALDRALRNLNVKSAYEEGGLEVV